MKNEKAMFDFEKDQDNAFNRLSDAMNKVNQYLTFEFGPKLDNGKREFVISANGIKEAFPAVEALFASAPKSDKFIFIKFRPRRTSMTLRYGGKEVNPKDVICNLFKDDDKVGIMVFFKDYKQSERDVWATIGYLLLDQSLGEYDVETKVGFIGFLNRDSEYNKNSFPITELSKNFDEYYKKEFKTDK